MSQNGSTFAVLQAESGVLIAERARAADSPASRSRGLLGRDRLEPGEALWITPCEAVHTFFMRFAIDCVFLNRRKRIVKIVRNLKPWRIAGAWRAHSVLELPAGSADRCQLEVADQLVFRH